MQLIKTQAARRAIAEARRVDEVKDIRDKAEAIRLYATQAGLGTEMINDAAEIKLRAERRGGELIAQIERQPGKRSDTTSSQAGTRLQQVLSEADVSRAQADRWQQVAAIPTERFEQHVAATRQAGDELTTAGVLRLAANGYDYKRDAKSNRAADEYVPQGFDACQTPAYAIDPLLPFLPRRWHIWEPASGEGLLVEALYDSGFKHVIASDLLTGSSFFDFAPAHWDALVTNPPFSLKYRWLERCYQLAKPFALLLPVETLGAKTAQALFEQHGLELILLDQRVNFKMPNKGWEGGGAQFPVAWFTHGLGTGRTLTFGHLSPSP